MRNTPRPRRLVDRGRHTPLAAPDPLGLLAIERERLAARVQGGMAELLVAGVQPAAGGGVLAGIRVSARLSSRVAR